MDEQTGKSRKQQAKGLRLHGSIAHDLGVQIVSGRYRPGEVLVGEIEASERLHVSRTAYREAVRILAAKGLVVSKPKTGTTVNEQARWHLLDPDVLSWIFKSNPSPRMLDSLFELRRIVEPQAAALAAANRTDLQLERMQAGLLGMAEHTLASEIGREADQQFHEALLDAADNPFLRSLTSGIGAAVAWTTVFKQRHSPLRRDPIPDHQAVYDAIANKDCEGAHAAMIVLLERAIIDTQQTLEPGEMSGGNAIAGSPLPRLID